MDNSSPSKQDQSTISEAGVLPCLNSNISISAHPAPRISVVMTKEKQAALARVSPENHQKFLQQLTELTTTSTQHKKSAYVLKESVKKLAAVHGVEKLGFLTLTFAEHITVVKQAQKRLKSLMTHIIKPRYHDYIGVMERQHSGRIHYHLIVVLKDDIRTGFDFNQAKNRNYSSASPALRSEWAFWRKTAPAYRFGRTELMPVKSGSVAIAKYVGKYIAKHMECRTYQDKGARLVYYSQGARAGTTRFQFLSSGSKEWRRKVQTFVEILQSRNPDENITEFSDITRILGPKWAYKHREYILALP